MIEDQTGFPAMIPEESDEDFESFRNSESFEVSENGECEKFQKVRKKRKKMGFIDIEEGEEARPHSRPFTSSPSVNLEHPIRISSLSSNGQGFSKKISS